MRKLVESTFMTLDGVISNAGEWGQAFWDEEHRQYATDMLWAADALLLGRKTYEGFVQAWPDRTGDFADRINGMPKYVASRTLDQATWNASIIKADVAQEVARLKDEPGHNILKYGTGELDRTLLEHKLVDEYHFWIFPLLTGSGDRLVEGFDASLNLLGTTTFKSGIVVAQYAPK